MSLGMYKEPLASEHSQQKLAISLTNSDTATENQAFEMTSTSKKNLDFHLESIHEILMPKKKRKLGEEN
ncbi:hypothetical protein BpHYR1_040751 [Brachionus plicatilis]|uniref:Uncharacterized protein n=1 Tax=Brachionus plicatilis TaxID=10195 RepID=A0A3M7PCB8_BRAPC|nr:hypothetical protein BpHYR1_040751 [Brachionus plicatilis]